MKAATGQASVLNIILIVVGIIMLILIGSLSYSKAFKIKTKVINIIEKHKGADDGSSIKVEAKKEIDSLMRDSGYSIIRKNANDMKCPNIENGKLLGGTSSGYAYCVYRFDTVKGPYYHVTVYIGFDLPIINSFLRIPISGDTRVIYEL